MKRRSLLILIGFYFTSTPGFAQNETNHWMFGWNAGLNFSSGAPVGVSGPLYTMEGSTSISDPVTGNLLMYTDGMAIYNAAQNPMPNGTNLKGHVSSTQAALILPKPGSSTLFYVFTSDASENSGAFGYNYSVVDMTLNSGLGDVIASQKNIQLFAPGNEQLSAVKHANCIDWWIMTKEKDNNIYKAYLITSTGVSAPVSSAIGIGTPASCSGQAKFSPNGAKYAISTGTGTSSLIQLFDFDNATGILSNAITLVNAAGDQSYGLSFSGDNSKLYIGRGVSAGGIYQYDLSSGNPATIIASSFIVGAITSGQLQLGKDFKIYISNFYASSLTVINNPNALGSACGFTMDAIPLIGSCQLGICNFPDSYFNQSNPCIVDSPVPEEPETIPHIPNIITPNGDGINDVFKIGNLLPASSLSIMNRWGNLVFTTDNYPDDWMGDNADGVYFYKLKTPDGRVFSGFVQVVTE